MASHSDTGSDRQPVVGTARADQCTDRRGRGQGQPRVLRRQPERRETLPTIPTTLCRCSLITVNFDASCRRCRLPTWDRLYASEEQGRLGPRHDMLRNVGSRPRHRFDLCTDRAVASRISQGQRIS